MSWIRRHYLQQRYHNFFYGLRLFHIAVAILFFINVSANFNFKYLTASVLLGLFLSFWGFNITAHRFIAHQAFKASTPATVFLYSTYFLGGMTSPLYWNVLHRMHHIYSDTEKDPHSPKNLSGLRIFIKIFFSYFPDISIGFHHVRRVVSIKHIRAAHKWGFEFLLLYNLFVFLTLGISGVFYVVVLPTLLVNLNIWFQGVTAHQREIPHPKTKDYSVDSFLLGILTLGDGFHASHHLYPSRSYHLRKKGEFPDLPGWVISKFFKSRAPTERTDFSLRRLAASDLPQMSRINSQHDKIMGLKKYDGYNEAFEKSAEQYFEDRDRYFVGAFLEGELRSFIGVIRWQDFPFWTIVSVKASRETHLFKNSENSLIKLTSYVIKKELDHGCVAYWFLTSRRHHRGSVEKWRNATPELTEFKFITRTIEKNYKPKNDFIFELMGGRIWNEDLVIRIGVKKGHELSLEKFFRLLEISDFELNNEDTLQTIYC